jgi:hypothetical protein
MLLRKLFNSRLYKLNVTRFDLVEVNGKDANLYCFNEIH